MHRSDRLETATGAPPRRERPGAADVRASFVALADRFDPQAASGLDACWVIDVAGVGTYTMRVADGTCTVTVGGHPRPDATIRTDPATWQAVVAGHEDGVRAFTRGALRAQGDLNLALRLETLFRPAPAASRTLRTVRVDADGVEVEAFVAGSGPPVLLLHGLAASKVSFLPTVDGLGDHYEVHALDLPGHGKSDKPLPTGGRYSPRWTADVVRAYLHATAHPAAFVVGNSMGGRVAVELALRHRDAVRGVVGLGAAVAFDEYQQLGRWLQVLQGQWLGVAPFPLSRMRVQRAIAAMFSDCETLPTGDLAAAAEEFLRCSRDPRTRLAILACARHLTAERASGRRSFWRQLAELRVPSLWIYGEDDPIVSHRYAARVRQCVPHAQVEVWPDIGHVPQFEAPQRTNDTISAFLSAVDGDGVVVSHPA